MDEFTYVIIGGGMAGQRACEGIRRVDTEGSIALVTQEPHRPYQRPPLSKGYLQGREGLDKVYLQEASYYAENRIELLQGVAATRIDPAAHTVSLADGRELRYKKLLLATGGRARRLPLPGADLRGVLVLRTIEDSDAISEAAAPGRRVVIVGGSFIGAEVAASLTQRGAEVSMVFPEERLLKRVASAEVGAMLHDMYTAHGVRIHTGVVPERFEGDGRVERVVLADGTVLPTDLVVMGVGIVLNTELAREAGLEMTDHGAVLVDRYLRTSDADIYAAGDIAAWPDRTFDKVLRVEHWDVARRHGLRAGRNMAGDERRYVSLPYFFSDMFDLSIEVWGDLTTWDRTVVRGDISARRFTDFYFSEGTLVGVLTTGRDQERDALQALVRARIPEGESERLVDESVELDELLPKEKAAG
ncbi:MAG: NAD(P)/FAD-dependent oxidoreductase [Anaerolineae bacterium]